MYLAHTIWFRISTTTQSCQHWWSPPYTHLTVETIYLEMPLAHEIIWFEGPVLGCFGKTCLFLEKTMVLGQNTCIQRSNSGGQYPACCTVIYWPPPHPSALGVTRVMVSLVDLPAFYCGRAEFKATRGYPCLAYISWRNLGNQNKVEVGVEWELEFEDKRLLRCDTRLQRFCS